MKVRQLLYISSQSRQLVQSDIMHIVQHAQTRNLKYNVTGLLLFLEGAFCQVIEGTENDVEIIYNYICKDTSHHNMMVLQDDFIEGRSFSDWSMAYQELDHDDFTRTNVEEIKKFISKKFNLRKIGTDFVPVMLHSFIYNHTKTMKLPNQIKRSN